MERNCIGGSGDAKVMVSWVGWKGPEVWDRMWGTSCLKCQMQGRLRYLSPSGTVLKSGTPLDRLMVVEDDWERV